MSRQVCVGNLSLSVTRGDLKSKFEQFGRVVSVALSADSNSRHGKRSGLVEMASESEAEAAISCLNMTRYEGDVISVYLAAQQPRE